MNLLNNGMLSCYADSVYPTVMSHRVSIYLIRIIGASSRQNTRLSWLIDSHSIRFHGFDCLAPRLNKQNILNQNFSEIRWKLEPFLLILSLHLPLLFWILLSTITKCKIRYISKRILNLSLEGEVKLGPSSKSMSKQTDLSSGHIWNPFRHFSGYIRLNIIYSCKFQVRTNAMIPGLCSLINMVSAFKDLFWASVKLWLVHPWYKLWFKQ